MIARVALAAGIALAVVAPSPSLAAPGWLASAPVTPEGSLDFQMGMTPGGAVTAVWMGSESGHPAIRTTMRPPGGAFTPARTISQGVGDNGTPSLAVAPSGTALAAWAQKNAQGAWVVQAAVRSPAGDWSAAEPVSTATTADPTPVAAIADSGELFVGWIQPTVTRPQVRVARRLPGGSWPATPDDVSLASDTASEPHLAVDAQGNATALWLQLPGGSGTTQVIATSSRAANDQWTTPVPLTPVEASGTASVPDLATSRAGRVAAIWYRYGLTRVESADHAFGAPWSAVTKAGNPSHYASDRPEIEVDGTGTATASWSDGSGIQATRLSPSGTWPATTTPLSSGVFADAFAPQVAGSPDGLTLVAWRAQDIFNASHLQAATRTLTGSWSPAQDLGASASRIQRIVDGVDDQGNGIVLWYSAAGMQSRVYDVGGPDLLDLSVPAGGSAGQALGFSVNPRDRWSAVSSTTWDFGDGATATGPQASHAFAEGVYTVRVTSADALGNTASATRTVAVGPPPPPPPAIKPLLTSGTGSITARFKRSAITGKSSVTVAGALNVARRLAVVLNGPMRPAGKRADAALGSFDASAGSFSRTLTLPKAVAKKLLPGAYELRVSGADVAATWRANLRRPADGVVLSKKMSTSRKGLTLSSVSRAKQLWATFNFAPGAGTTKKLTVRWFSPAKQRPVGTFPVQGAHPFSFWKNAHGLAKGTWRAVLMAGKAQVSTLSIKVG